MAEDKGVMYVIVETEIHNSERKVGVDMDCKLKFKNRSNDADNSKVIIFEKDTTASEGSGENASLDELNDNSSEVGKDSGD